MLQFNVDGFLYKNLMYLVVFSYARNRAVIAIERTVCKTKRLFFLLHQCNPMLSAVVCRCVVFNGETCLYMGCFFFKKKRFYIVRVFCA